MLFSLFHTPTSIRWVLQSLFFLDRPFKEGRKPHESTHAPQGSLRRRAASQQKRKTDLQSEIGMMKGGVVGREGSECDDTQKELILSPCSLTDHLSE